MNKILISALIMLFALTTLLAQAGMDHKGHKQCGQGHDCDKGQMMHKGRGDKPMVDIWEHLKLTPEQLQKIRALREANAKLVNTVQAEIRNLMIDLRNAIETEKFPHARAIQKQISDKRLQLAEARLNLMESVLKELTAEQKEAFRKMRPMMGRGEGMFSAPCLRRGGNMKRRGMHDYAGDCDDCQ